jgi:hypothetical protein
MLLEPWTRDDPQDLGRASWIIFLLIALSRIPFWLIYRYVGEGSPGLRGMTLR